MLIKKQRTVAETSFSINYCKICDFTSFSGCRFFVISFSDISHDSLP
eukprot:UN00827